MCPARYSSAGRTSRIVTSPLRTRRSSSSPCTDLERAASLDELPRHEIDFRQARRRQLAQRRRRTGRPRRRRAGTRHTGRACPRSTSRAARSTCRCREALAIEMRGLAGQRLDGAGALAQQVEQFESLRGRDGLADAGELLVDAVLELPLRPGHAPSILVFTRIIQWMAGAAVDRGRPLPAHAPESAFRTESYCACGVTGGVAA